ncbi:MAG TPA: GtrA family protein [Usitatibacter sp.]|nr:GtrA family protein [Usitatibacter sp.]
MSRAGFPSGTPMEFVRFLAVGLGNTVFGYAVFALLVLAGVAPMPALVLTYVAGIVFNFFTTRRFVFRAAGGLARFARFVAAYAVVYAANVGLYRLAEAAGAGPLAAQAVCLPIVAVFSFLLFKLAVFRGP